MMRKRILKVLFVLAVTGGGVSATADAIDAHAPNVWRDCSGLHVQFVNYEGGGTNNVLGVHIVNGDKSTSYMQTTFGSSYSNDFAWSQFDSHSYTVTVDANVNNGDPTKYDKTFTGSIEACVVTTTTTTEPATTTTTEPATTTTAVDQVEPPVPCPWNPTVPVGDPSCVQPTFVTGNPVVVPATTVAVVVECISNPALAGDDPACGAASSPSLPSTGVTSTGILVLAAFMVFAGFVLYLIKRGGASRID